MMKNKNNVYTFYHYDKHTDSSIIVNELKLINIEKDNIEISWDQYFMAIANLVRCRSKDPVTKVGACLVLDNKIISTGYNGFPRNISNEKYPWTKGSEDETANKFFYVVHAELNAILNSPTSPSGSTLYVTKFPCNECAKAIIQAGIKKIIYTEKEDPLFSEKKHYYSKQLLIDAGIEIEEYKYSDKGIVINI